MKGFLISQNTHGHLCRYPAGFEYAGTNPIQVKIKEIEIETKAIQRQVHHQIEELEMEKDDKFYPKAQATWRSLRLEPLMDTIDIYPFKLVRAPYLFG